MSRRQSIIKALHDGVPVPILPKSNATSSHSRVASKTPVTALAGDVQSSRTSYPPVAQRSMSVRSASSAPASHPSSRRLRRGSGSAQRSAQGHGSPAPMDDSRKTAPVTTVALSLPRTTSTSSIPAKHSPQSKNHQADFAPTRLAVPASAGRRTQKHDRGFGSKQPDAQKMQTRASSRASAAAPSTRTVSPMSHLGSPRFSIEEVQAKTKHRSSVHRIQDTRPDLQLSVNSTGMVIEGTELEMRAMESTIVYSLRNPGQMTTDEHNHGRKQGVVPFPREIPVKPLQGYVRVDGTVRSRPDSPATSVASSSGSRK